MAGDGCARRSLVFTAPSGVSGPPGPPEGARNDGYAGEPALWRPIFANSSATNRSCSSASRFARFGLHRPRVKKMVGMNRTMPPRSIQNHRCHWVGDWATADSSSVNWAWCAER